MKISTLLIWCQVIIGLGLCVRAQIPNCNFYDTVDLTNSQKFENGSYLYDGVLIPAELVAIYDYTEVDDVREEGPEHVRGCVCKVKQCVQFCCPLDKRKVPGEKKCEAASEDQLEFEPYLNITDSKHVQHQLHIREDVVVQANLVCAEGFIWNLPEDVYNLYRNGVLAGEYTHSYTKNQYCISFGFGPDGAYGMMPMTCATKQDNWDLISKCVMCVSIVCCLLTIFVNILVPELLKLLGKCLTSHLIALSVSFGFLVFSAFSSDFDHDTCIYIGIGTYFFVMASFFWLSVIGFDLYVTLRSTNFSHRYSQNRKFLFYSLYAWISALVLTVILTVLQYTMNGPLAPNLQLQCFVETVDTWSAMIYLHAPLLIILVANTVFFTLTIYHIWQVQNGPNAVNAASAKREQADREVKQPMFGESTKPQPSAREVQKRKQKEQFGLFLRMFLLMGIIWLVEVISYMLPKDSLVKSILISIDLLNCGKGILVFIIFICRKKVFVQVKNRILCKEIPAADLDSLYEFSLQDIGITTKQQNDDEN